jgi:hypothetical protein
MQSMDIPCGRCEEFRQRFEAAGFRVLDCKSSGAAGMCSLRWELPEGAVPSAAPAKSRAAARKRPPPRRQP